MGTKIQCRPPHTSRNALPLKSLRNRISVEDRGLLTDTFFGTKGRRRLRKVIRVAATKSQLDRPRQQQAILKIGAKPFFDGRIHLLDVSKGRTCKVITERLKIAARSALAALVLTSGAIPVQANPSDAPFIAQINAAMTKMMNAMNVSPSGDVDKDFVDAMVPHHEGAIEMSEAELRFGHNEQLRRIAQEIIVTQQEEITAMRLAVGEPLPPSKPAPDQTRKRQER